MKIVSCLPCQIHKKSHIFFSPKALAGFDIAIFDGKLYYLDEDTLHHIELFLSAYDDEDIEEYHKQLELHGCENCELCKRSYFFINIIVLLTAGIVEKYRTGELREEERERVERIVLRLMDFIPSSSVFSEALCNALMPEANRFLEDPEGLNVENERSYLRKFLILFPDVARKAISKVSNADNYIQYLDDLADCYDDEDVRETIYEILDNLNDLRGKNESPVEEREQYDISNKRKFYEKVDKKQKVSDLYYNKWEKFQEKGASYYAKFKLAVDFFYNFKSFAKPIDDSIGYIYIFLKGSFLREKDRIHWFCKGAIQDLGIDDEIWQRLSFYAGKDYERSRLRNVGEMAIPEAYKHYYYELSRYFSFYKRHIEGIESFSFESRLAIISVFTEVFAKYIEKICKQEAHLIKDTEEFESKFIDKLFDDLKKARKEAWLHAKYRWFESKLGLPFYFCFPRKIELTSDGKFWDVVDEGSCGLEYLSTCLSRFFEDYKKNENELLEMMETDNDRWREFLDRLPFHEYFKDQIGPWYSLRRIRIAEMTNFFEIIPFLAEGTWIAEHRGWDEIAEMIREILESEESDEELEKRCRDKYIGITGIFGRDGRIQDEEEEINEDQEREGEEESVQNDDMQDTTVQETDLIDFVLEDEKKQKKQRRKGILDRLKETVSESVKGLLERKKEKK